jgi:hypothetical protein
VIRLNESKGNGEIKRRRVGGGLVCGLTSSCWSLSLNVLSQSLKKPCIHPNRNLRRDESEKAEQRERCFETYRGLKVVFAKVWSDVRENKVQLAKVEW